MLRHCGIFLGADAGPIESRKFHESKSFRDVNKHWLGELIDFPHAPKGIQQFRKLEIVSTERIETLTADLDIQGLLESFRGGHRAAKPWGWKDPRNSATAWIWKTLFPAAQVIVLKREWNSQTASQSSRSVAGEWFRRRSKDRVRQCYLNPMRITAEEIFTVDFDRLLRNEDELNGLLRQLGLRSYCIADFDEFRTVINVESK